MMRDRNVPGAMVCALVLVLSCAASPALAQNGAVDGQWRAYAADIGATKYSSLDQIDAGNVNQLQIAWTRPTVDQSILDVVPNLGYNNANRSTPLMVDGIVYAPNAVGLVEAWDPATGETIWVQQPFEEGPAGFRGAGHRARWRHPSATSPCRPARPSRPASCPGSASDGAPRNGPLRRSPTAASPCW